MDALEFINEQEAISSRLSDLEPEKTIVLDRAREVARLTIPFLLPEEGHAEESRFKQPNQSLGARAVNNLSSKLLLTLLPPNTSFFRLYGSEELSVSTQVMEQQQPGAISKVEMELARIERNIKEEIDKQSIRVKSYEAFRHLIVTGNVLLQKVPDSGIKLYDLEKYVIQRDHEGNVLDLIITETIAPEALPSYIAKQIDMTLKVDNKEECKLYTRAVRVEHDKFIVYQEVEDILIEESIDTYDLDMLPFIPLRWTAIDGESYGRGLGEQYIGDLRDYNVLSRSISESANIASKTWFIVRPGTTKVADLKKAPNGGFISGNVEDISSFKVDKASDMSIALQQAQILDRRLSQAFLLNSSVTRDAERVTALEIQYMAGELEDALGGVYSVLAQEFQLPLVRLMLQEFGTEVVKLTEPIIVTGMEALGRTHDLQKMQTFLQLLSSFSPELAGQYVNMDVLVRNLQTNLGLDMPGLVKTQEQIQQEQRVMMEQQLIAQGASNMVDENTKGQG